MFSLKQQISKIMVMITVILSVLMFTLLSIMIRNYQNRQSTKRLEEMTAYAETLDESILQLNNIVGIIYSSSKEFEGLSIYRSPVEKHEYVYELLNQLGIQVKSNKNLSGLFVYYDNAEKEVYYVRKDMSFADKNTLKESGKAFVEKITSAYEGDVVDTGDEVYFNVFLNKSLATVMGNVRLSHGLPLERDEAATYGVIFEQSFYRTAGRNEQLTNEVCATLQPGKNIAGDSIIYLHDLDAAEIAVVEILPKNIWLYVGPVHILLAVLMGFLAFLLYRLYQFIYIQISRPLDDMTSAMEQIHAGTWEVEFHAENRIMEIENVRRAVSIMLKKIEEYKIRSYEEKLEKQKTELQYLQLQLAPHFYTNCLKNAYYMLVMKEYDHVEQFLLHLSSHLRYLLQKDTAAVTVQTEKEFVENYFKLQKLMTSKPINYQLVVSEEALEQRLPLLSIQTFVENAVKYSWQPGEKDLSIRIRVQYLRTEGQRYLDVVVADNGDGYPEEVLDMLNQEFPSQKDSLGVGIINLLSRIRIQFGEGAKWCFSNDGGASSELLLPLGNEVEDEYLNS